MHLRALQPGAQPLNQNRRAGPTLPARRPGRTHLVVAAQNDGSQRDSSQKPGFTLKWVPALLTDSHAFAVGALATATVVKLAEITFSGVASSWEKDMRPAIDASPENLEAWKATMREAVEDARKKARANLSATGANVREAWGELLGGVEYYNSQVAKEAEIGAANWKKTSEAIKTATAPLEGDGAAEGPDVVALLAEAEQEGAQRIKELGKELFGRKEGLPTGWGGQLPGLPGLSSENTPAPAAPAPAAPAATPTPEDPAPAAPAAAAAAAEVEKNEEKKEEAAPAPAPAPVQRKGIGSAAMAAVAKMTGRVIDTTKEAVKKAEEKAAEAKKVEEKAPAVAAAATTPAPTPAPPSPPTPPPPAKSEPKPAPEPVKAVQEEKKVEEKAPTPVAVAAPPAPAPTPPPAPAKPALDPVLEEATKGGRHISMLSAPMSTDVSAAAAATAAAAGSAALGWSSNSGSGSGSAASASSGGGSSSGSATALRAAATSGGGGSGSDGGSSGGGGGGGGDGGKGDNDESPSSDSDWNPWLLFLLTAVVVGQSCYTQTRQNRATGNGKKPKSN